MENRLKLKMSKMFHSCRSKNSSDVSDQPFFFPENSHHRQLIDLFSPKPQSLCKPKWYFEDKPKSHLSAPKNSGKNTSFPVDIECRKPQKATKKKFHYRKPKTMEDFSSATDNYYYDWRSSDEEDDSDGETTLFSFHSFSSESSRSFRKNRVYRKSQRKSKRMQVGGGGGGDDSGSCGCKNQKASADTPLENSGKLVNDSFAVVKKSSNPHEDFRVSMVEMIVEQQIFGAEGLENLLECFISLNSEEHHRVIFEVFIEIWEALFSPPV